MASDPSEPTLEQLINSRNRDLSSFLPQILRFVNSRRDSETPDQEPSDQPRDRLILINPQTQGMIVIESSTTFEALFREMMQGKEGLPPASKASIEAMKKVVITEEEKECECAICLDGWEIGGEATEMPCKHKFHGGCIEKWLGIHGSCPVCRFEMPVEEEEGKKTGGGEGEEERGAGRRGIWVSIFGVRRSPDSSDDSSDSSDSAEADSSS